MSEQRRDDHDRTGGNQPPARRAGAEPLQAGLSSRDRRILDFEGSWWLHTGAKDAAIREHLGMSATRYYQAIRRLMAEPAAGEYAPLTVHRLHRMKRVRLEQIAERVQRDSLG
ncbi:MAG: DUF3263 domain-containing protein [Acidimicrobiia bacterium]|nr:DUF3263 domain-containing protein [Acidimicrobiia bacterium]